MILVPYDKYQRMRESVPTNNNVHTDYDVTSTASRHIEFGPPGIRVTPKKMKKKRDIVTRYSACV